MSTQAKPICPQCEAELLTHEEIKQNACNDCWADFATVEDEVPKSKGCRHY
jgi:uncharacterized Zn ribbon protein